MRRLFLSLVIGCVLLAIFIAAATKHGISHENVRSAIASAPASSFSTSTSTVTTTNETKNGEGVSGTYSQTVSNGGSGSQTITRTFKNGGFSFSVSGPGSFTYHFGGGSAQSVVNSTVAAAAIRSMNVQTDYGTITIEHSSDPAMIAIAATVSLGDDGQMSSADRKRLLQGFVASNHVTGSALAVDVAPPASLPKSVGWTVSYRIQVPETVSLDLKSDNGAVGVDNVATTGAVRAHSDYGNIDVANSGSTVDVSSENGQISVSESAAVQSVSAHSDYGSISVDGDIATVTANTENGAVSIHGAGHDQDVNASSSYGQISLDNIAGPVKANTENGSIQYSGSPSSLQLKSDYGSINVSIASAAALADADISTENGSITASLPSAASVHVSGHTDNGSISANGFPAHITGGDYDKSVDGVLNGGRNEFHCSSDYGSLMIDAH